MTKIKKIFIPSSITKPIYKQQRNLNPNKSQILRNFKYRPKYTIVIDPHSNNIDNLNDIDTDKNNRSNNLMFSKYTDKQCHNEVSNETYKYIIIIFYLTFTYCLHFLVVYVLVFVHEVC